MYALYSILYGIVLLVLFFPQYLRRPREIRNRWLREKMGFLPERGQALWFHAVSVGEVNASLSFIRRIVREFPEVPVVLSTMTDTGNKVAREKVPPGVTVVYIPFDLPWVLHRAVRRVVPRLFAVLETEYWPNILRIMASRGAPVLVLNGRISERSVKGYRRLSFFMRRILSPVRLFCMQSETDAARLRLIGADPGGIMVTGNFKFDMEMPKEEPAWCGLLRGPVIVAGSTHRGEEEIVIAAYRENMVRFPDLKLILAPRHPERFSEVERLLAGAGVRFVRRTELRTGSGDRRENGDAAVLSGSCVVLLDTVGELSSVYRVADVAIIGKSILGVGGQNPLEPAYWGKPILCGPHMENFPFVQDFHDAGAAFPIDQSTLAKKVKELLMDPEKAHEAGRKARMLYERNSGAVDRAVKIVGAILGSP